MTTMAEIDHLIWVAPELGEAVDDLEERFGLRPQEGGRHPGVGTHNALVNLDRRRYLEILAPDPTQDRLWSFGRLVRGVKQAHLITWAARVDDVNHLSKVAKAAGLHPGMALSMSRQRPDGSTLSWRLLTVGGHPHGHLLPFFIEWRDGGHACDRLDEHPCRLLDLTLHSTQSAALDVTLRALGLEVPVIAAERPRLVGRFETPRGTVTLSSDDGLAGTAGV
jgi:Glyoxalase-like domain